jgi:O-antigen/teichoic acid export membrane protein
MLLGWNHRGALGNIVTKALSVPVEKACRFVLVAIVARQLGVAAFGRFQFADTVTALLVLATDMGLGIWTTRALAREPARAGEIVGTGFGVRSLSAVPYLLLLAAAAWAVGHGEARSILLLLGISALAGAVVEYCNAVFRGHERLRDEARLNVTRALLVTTAGLGALWWGRSLVALGAGIAVGSIAAAVYGVGIIRRRYRLATSLPGPFVAPFAGWSLRRGRARAAVVEALPLWLASLASLIYFKGDAVLLRLFAGDAAVGSYGAAFKIFEATMILPSIILAATFPGLVRAEGGGDRRRRLRSEVALALVLLGLGCIVGGTIYLVRDLVIALVFGSGFRDALPSLVVLCVSIPLLFLNYGLTHFLIARNLERRNLAFAIAMVLLNLGLNLALIPRLGGRGAALTTLATEVALTACCLVTLGWRPASPARRLRSLRRPRSPRERSATNTARTSG